MPRPLLIQFSGLRYRNARKVPTRKSRINHADSFDKMMSNYSFLGSGGVPGNSSIVVRDDKGNTLEMTELEMQDLTDSLDPIQYSAPEELAR